MSDIPQVTVVVPVYNGGDHLERCLDALLASEFRDYEIIVVDDNSTDESAELCRARGLKVIQLTSRRGPAGARNCGASHARAPIILFLDSDVLVRRDTLARIIAHFRQQARLAALFGSYDDEPAAGNFVSQYKNLLHHFVHQRSRAVAATFWAGCGAVRREAFEAVGGFDERKYERPSIEDIELGYRLRQKDFTILLDRELQVKHLKRWSLLSLLRTDIFDRALPWSQLIVENDGLINDLNLRTSDRVSAGLSGLAVALFILSYFHQLSLVGMFGALAAVLLLNLELIRFFKIRRGVWFSIRAFVMLVLYYLYSGLVFTLVYCSQFFRRAGRTAHATEVSTTKDA